MSYTISEKIQAMWDIIRPIDGIVMGVGLIVAMFLAGSYQKNIPLIFYILVFLAGFLLSSHAMIVNDIIDLEIDKINEPGRALPKGLISIQTAWIYAIVLGILGVVSFGLVDLGDYDAFPYLWLYGLFHLILADFYNYKLKETGFIGNITVAYMAYALFLAGDLFINGGLTLIPQIIGIMAFCADLAREIYKGIIDQEGDAEHGIRTIAVQLGPTWAKYIATAIFSVCIVVGIYAFPQLMLIGKIGMALVLMLFVYVVYLAKDADIPAVSRKIKTYIILGPLFVSPFLILDQILMVSL